MPTKSDRILSYLPGTFKRQARLSALMAVVDAFGRELLDGENSLAAIMQAHWVDHADRGSDVINDLARIAALYGLAPRCETPPDPPLLCAPPPRCDETVEEFREHLKRYVRTFLDGTVTVQGILRIAAENLGVRIADAYDDMDPWWRRSTDQLITWRPRGDDIAGRLLGFAAATAVGRAATRANIQGSADLSRGVDLSDTPILRLQVDEQPAVEIDFLEGRSDPVVPLSWITTVINNAVGSSQVAHDHDGFLRLTSIVSGTAARLKILGGSQDAAPALLGIAPRHVTGRAASPATVTGRIDLSGGIDLSEHHFIRLVVDRTAIYEIELPAGAEVTLDQITDGINTIVGQTITTHDGQFLTLTSTTTGFNSSLSLEPPAAQDATFLLFGDVDLFHLGQDAQPARFQGLADLSRGVDLSQRANIALALDGAPAVTINCAGSDPANTRLSEITATINQVIGDTVALHNGRFVTVSSPTVGPAGIVEFDIAAENDASDLIMGLTPRTAAGKDGTAALIKGTAVHDEPLNLITQHRLLISADDRPAVEIDLHHGPADRTAATLGEIVQAINDQVGMPIAQHDGQTVTLISVTVGDESRLAVRPLEEQIHRRFVTRTPITDEAATAVLGFVSREATGSDGKAARVVGQKDLSRGVDLREGRYLRIAVDGPDFVDIDCAGVRPHATTLGDLVTAINQALGSDIASTDEKFLTLTSANQSSASRIAFAPPQATNAWDLLLGQTADSATGRNATGVRLIGTVDLSEGIELPAGAALRLGVDDADPATIVLTETAAQLSLNQVVNVINITLGITLATTDGTRLILRSPTSGKNSRLIIEAAPNEDVTAALLGFDPPRTYLGSDPLPALIEGQVVLDQPVDMTTRRFLAIGLNGGPVTVVDCATMAADPASVSLASIIGAINTRLAGTVASDNGGRLVLSSLTRGSAGSVVIEDHFAGDARQRLFGEVPDETLGEDALPASITGEVDLLAGIDLSERSILRLKIDQRPPLDIYLAGLDPAATFVDEMVTALNDVVPGLARATADDRLQLSSPTAGSDSYLAVQPLRYLELVEYPPGKEKKIEEQATHGHSWSVINSGAADSFVEITLIANRGVAGPALVNRALNVQVRLQQSFSPGDIINLWADDFELLRATVQSTGDLAPRSIPAEKVIVGSCDTSGKAADFLARANILRLPRGRSDWMFLECPVARFDAAYFDRDHFANGICFEPGIFDASCFAGEGVENPIQTVFADTNANPSPETTVRFTWREHQPAAFEVNLPHDLPARFGGRFDKSRFGINPNNPEVYKGVVASPPGDANHLVVQIQARDRSLVEASIVNLVPLGWESFEIPFRQPHFLTLGRAEQNARLYLSAEGLEGFIEIRAREPGGWGNDLAVSVRPAGPALYDVCVIYEGGRFESARQAVEGEPAPPLVQEMKQASPVGVLQAKAAGVWATVTRERVD
ncbi:MAG: hypothetical protein QNJ45_08600 [Ardenticatenaceae bacterium]|nr:hypothetical protein [Ardenticatenaceae bacterium]